jgi:hypothetical protein
MLGLGVCFLTTLVFGLLGVGRRFSEREKRVPKMTSPASLEDAGISEDTADAQTHRPSPPIPVSKASTAE